MSYDLINWEDSPSTKTPINAENLKHMDEGIAQAHDMADELEVYKANSIIQTSSGTTFCETDCAAVSPVNIKLFGKSKQETVPGNQLFDASLMQSVSNDEVSINNNGDGTFTIGILGDGSATVVLRQQVKLTHEETINLLKAGTINMDCGIASNPYFYVQVRNSSSVYLERGNLSDSRALPMEITQEMLDDNESYLQFGFYTSTSSVITSGTVSPMVYQDGDGSFEPYVGGEQSPNMRYPQQPEFLGEGGSIVGKAFTGNLLKLTDREFVNGNGSDLTPKKPKIL